MTDEEIIREARRSTLQWTIRLVVAAVAVLLAFFVASRLLQEETLDSQELYARYFGQVEIAVDDIRGEEVWKGAPGLISTENYAQAIPVLELLQADSAFAYRVEATLYLAQCQLKLANPQAALDQLETIPSDHPAYGTDKLWLMAMVHLSTNEATRARLILNQLLESETYGSKAKDMLEKWVD